MSKPDKEEMQAALDRLRADHPGGLAGVVTYYQLGEDGPVGCFLPGEHEALLAFLKEWSETIKTLKPSRKRHDGTTLEDLFWTHQQEEP